MPPARQPALPRLLAHAAALFLVGLTLACAPAPAMATDPPAGYYNSATGAGATLKSQLHNIIDNHTQRSYDDARFLLQQTDADPNDPDRMILVYDRVSLDVSAINPNGDIPGWDQADTWNREHTWPRSRGVNSSGADNSDLHQLRPSFTSTNSQRGNLNFGGAFGSNGGSHGQTGGFWYPGDEDAGLIARQQFYMAVRYDGSDTSTEDLELVNGSPGIGGDSLGDLGSLIDWHFEAPPDEFELLRNQRVFGIQNNRNPFTDHPEFAWSVIMNTPNDSRITLSGAAGISTSSSNASTLDLNFGRVLVGASAPADQVLTLNKSGNNGAYYQVTASGDATSSLSGRLNAFSNNGADSESLTVGLNASTLTAGTFTGSVTIDNLDVTTGGVTGSGANDGDDVIDLILTVLEHATPSFSTASEVTELTIDFGTLTEGGDAGLSFVTLANLAANPAQTANLDLISVTPSGQSEAFIMTAAPFSGINAVLPGFSQQRVAVLTTETVGSFAASYDLLFADENLPGRDFTTLTLNLLGEVVAAPLAGDFNNDGRVDAADYSVWRDGFAANQFTTQDYLDWQANFGATASVAAAAAVPEPGSAWLLLGLAAGGVWRRRGVSRNASELVTSSQ